MHIQIDIRHYRMYSEKDTYNVFIGCHFYIRWIALWYMKNGKSMANQV